MILELKDICKDYVQGKEPVPVLKHVNLEVDEGDYVAIMGPSLELSSRLEAGGCAVRASPGRLGSLAQPQRRGTSP